MATKEINCTHDMDSVILNYGEPCALFSVKLPKEAKILSKQTDKERLALSAMCLQPSLGKLIASDAKILTAMGVECSGEWPEDIDSKPFECFIDPKAISSLAGKEVDVAVWQNKYGEHYITGCEALGVRTQCQMSGARFTNWRRAVWEDSVTSIGIAEKEIPTLQTFIKEHMGKTNAERKMRVVFLKYTSDIGKLFVCIAEIGEYNVEAKSIAEKSFEVKQDSTHDFGIAYQADRFYYAIQADFNGTIRLIDHLHSARFDGKLHTSMLMPLAPKYIRVDGMAPYFE